MDDEVSRLRREVRHLRRLLILVYPYIPLKAHGPRFQDALERAVMGDGWIDKMRRGLEERESPRAQRASPDVAYVAPLRPRGGDGHAAEGPARESPPEGNAIERSRKGRC